MLSWAVMTLLAAVFYTARASQSVLTLEMAATAEACCDCMQGDRYDSQRAVIGAKLQSQLQNLQVSSGCCMLSHNDMPSKLWLT